MTMAMTCSAGQERFALTVFTMPRPFSGHMGVIQRNAVHSWLRLRPACEVLLFGDDSGTAELARDLGIRHIPEVARNRHGTPLVNALFAAAERAAAHAWLAYVNADVILMADFLDAVGRTLALVPRGLMVCRRWDMDLTTALAFERGWEARLRAEVARTGRRRPHTALDVFVFPRGLFGEIPPFALGRGAWDNWLVYGARAQRVPVVDLSEVVLAVHQNHDYAHQPHPVRREADVWLTEEARKNRALVGDYAYAFSACDATHVLTPAGLRRNITPYALYRALALLSISRPCLAPLVRGLRSASERCPGVRRVLMRRINP